MLLNAIDFEVHQVPDLGHEATVWWLDWMWKEIKDVVIFLFAQWYISK